MRTSVKIMRAGIERPGATTAGAGKSRLMTLLAVAAVSLGSSPAASAHHSQSEFDLRSTVEVEGTVTKLEWRSPHARLYVDAENEKGEVVNWNFELPSPNTLMRRGWKRDALKAGDRVKVAASPARNFPTIGIAKSIKDADDKPLFTGTTPVYEPAEPESTPNSPRQPPPQPPSDR